MATRKLSLERGGPKRLRVRWGWRMKEVEVSLDGQAWKMDRAGLLAGTSITIPGGSTLFVQSVARKWWSVALRDELHVELDGVPVPGSDGDPRVIGRRAASLIALVGILKALLIGLWLVFQQARTGPQPLGTILVGSGLFLLALAVLAALGLRLPVLIAACLLGVELVATVAAVGGRVNGLGILIQVLVIVHLVGAWKRMRPRSATPSLAKVFE